MNKRKCHFKGCEEIGEYRAPSSPKDLGKYIWFCLNDIIGHRKTKQIGSNDTSYFEKISKISERMFQGMNNLENSLVHPSYYSSKYLNALATLGIDNKESSLNEIKSKFKKIVKELHPDTVGNNEKNKEKLTRVLEAYKIIKEQYDNNRKSHAK